jgi:hypothetical protein
MALISYRMRKLSARVKFLMVSKWCKIVGISFGIKTIQLFALAGFSGVFVSFGTQKLRGTPEPVSCLDRLERQRFQIGRRRPF